MPEEGGGGSSQNSWTRASSGTSGGGAKGTGGKVESHDEGTAGATGEAGSDRPKDSKNDAMGRGGSAGTGSGAQAGAAGVRSGGAAGGAGRASAGAAGGEGTGTGLLDGGTADGAGAGGSKPEATSAFGTGADYTNCVRPSHHSAADMQAIWELVQKKFVTSSGANGFRRVQRTEYSNDTVSEGIGYGMIVAAYAGDCQLVGDLWDYSQKYKNDHGFMHWHINADGSVAEQNGATDGDEDIAWGLLQASKKNCKNKDFSSLAKEQIDRIWKYEVSNGVVAPGDHWGQTENKTNPSYFAPAYYRVFAKVTGQNGWNDVASKSYQFIKNDMNKTTGLVSEWCKMSDGSALDSDYGYNAARLPLRIGEDLCLNGSADAKSYLMTVGAFFNSVGGDKIKTDYKIDGTCTQTGYGNSTYTGPAAVSMMVSTSFAENLDLAYDTLIKFNADDQDDKGTKLNYYNGTLGLLSMLVLNGAFTSD